MRCVMVRYKVKEGRAAENEALVRAVYEELHETDPDGLRYATFKLPDELSFVHVAAVDTEDGKNPLADVKAFARFQENIAERLEEGPETIQLTEVGSFGLLRDR
jgi:hypothetical protein